MEVLKGIGSNKFGRAQYSDIFSALAMSGLIKYDRKNNEYHITDEGNDVLENAYLNDMERIVTGRRKFESTHRGNKMKKLNITKEAFEKSNYFTRKYGKLAFVSESGNLFKTSKGNVLKFVKEARNLIKEGAGAGYTVHIKGLRFGNILDSNRVKDRDGYSYSKFMVEILPGEYEIEAEDYDNDFFWQEHEIGETASAQIDGGVAEIAFTGTGYDGADPEDEFREEIEGRELDIAFSYGHGWSHIDLPRDKPIKSDYIEIEVGDIYGSIDRIELNAPDLADAVNSGYESIFDQGDDSEEDE